MKLLKTFDDLLIKNIFAILVNNSIVSEDHFKIFEKIFKDKSKGSFLCMTSLCVIRMSFTDTNSLEVDIKPLTDLGEYPNLISAINKSIQDIEQFLIDNYSNVKSNNTIIDDDFMKDFDKKKKEFSDHNLSGFIWDQLSNIYMFLEEIKTKMSTIQNVPKNYFGKPENPDANKDNNFSVKDLFDDNPLFSDENKSNSDNMATYKHLDEGIVTDEILTLLKNKGTVTNLDIKLSLRSKGYWATQTLISDMMGEIIDESDKLYSTNNGQYNTYHLSTDDDDDDDDPIIGTLSSQSTGGSFLPKGKILISALSRTNRKSRAPRGSFVPPHPILAIAADTGDWKITSISKPDIVYYPASLTREQARFSYHKLLNVDYHDTRSTKNK